MPTLGSIVALLPQVVCFSKSLHPLSRPAPAACCLRMERLKGGLGLPGPRYAGCGASRAPNFRHRSAQ